MTAAAEFTAGQEVTWTGTAGLFAHRVRIAAVRRSYLKILGETPEDARVVYDIADPEIKGTVLGIPAGQLHAIEPDPKLEAVTEALRSLPLEDRVPGYGGAGLSVWDKAEILVLLNEEG